MGPLKGLRFRRAKIMPGDGGGRLLNTAPASLGPPPRTSRTLEGNVVAVGVEGRTLTDVCGLRPSLAIVAAVGDAIDAAVDDALDALVCEGWGWADLIDDSDEEVDLRPRKLADMRLCDPC